MKLTLVRVIVLSGLCGFGVLAQNAPTSAKDTGHKFSVSSAAKLKIPGPEVQNLILGTYSTKVEYAPSEKMPKGAVATGTEKWWPGPGGYSVIEEYHEKGDAGGVDGFAIAWWDDAAHGQRYVWCDNSGPQSCSVSKSVAKWEGTRLVYTEEVEQAGKKVTRAEIFSDITPTSFTQLLQEGPSSTELKTVVTIHATKTKTQSK